jgi:hypothetical protein
MLTSDDTRASGPAPATRLPATTSRRVGRAFSSSTVCGRRACRSSRGPCGDAGNNPCRRQADQVVAPGSTGRRLLVEDDHWRLRQDADIEQPDCVGGGRRRPVGPLTGRACPDGRPGGGGVRSGHAQDDQETFDRGRRFARFRPRWRSSARARTARSRRRQQAAPDGHSGTRTRTKAGARRPAFRA